ncbi:hypothetical protein [Candidatus Poriferisodalis sp.]|uniref:hypothetical protein n=1 Tax=Candidatus Poriferisodalis sp. TaxID=3101277 RepID=UPI003B018785
MAPKDPLLVKLQRILDELATLESIKSDKFISKEIRSGTVDAVWALANACSKEALPRLSSPGILIGNDVVEQLDGRVALDDTTLGAVRATIFEDVERQKDCVHIRSLHGFGGGACSDENMVVAQLQLWFCETSRAEDAEDDVFESQGCHSAIPTTADMAAPAMVVVGSTDESELSLTLTDGRVLRTETHTVQGTDKRFFAIPIPGTRSASVDSIDGTPKARTLENQKVDRSTLLPFPGIGE